MTTTGFAMERLGKKSRAMVGPELEDQLSLALKLSDKSKQSPKFARCMDWLLENQSKLAKNGNPKLAAFEEHFSYYLKNLNERRIDPVGIWSKQGTPVDDDHVNWTKKYLPEFLSHITNGILGWREDVPAPGGASQMVSIYQQLRQRTVIQSSPMLRDKVPFTVVGLPSEANLNVLFPMFEKTLSVPGDVCEFGCFRGVTSIKMAFLIKAAGVKNKNVYAFDTFEGFQISDPGGGVLGVGAFSDHFDSFGELTKWGHALPIIPVKGDATKTCEQIKGPLSFVWLDLDMGVLMEPVLRKIWPYIGKDTIIGIDDVGRPETPTVEPWVDGLMKEGNLLEIARHKHEFIRFYQRA